MDLDLNDKYALVTGGSKGIGLAVALSLAGEGCHVHLAARNGDALKAAAENIRNNHGVEANIHLSDLSQSNDQTKLASDCRNVANR